MEEARQDGQDFFVSEKKIRFAFWDSGWNMKGFLENAAIHGNVQTQPGFTGAGLVSANFSPAPFSIADEEREGRNQKKRIGMGRNRSKSPTDEMPLFHKRKRSPVFSSVAGDKRRAVVAIEKQENQMLDVVPVVLAERCVDFDNVCEPGIINYDLVTADADSMYLPATLRKLPTVPNMPTHIFFVEWDVCNLIVLLQTRFLKIF